MSGIASLMEALATAWGFPIAPAPIGWRVKLTLEGLQHGTVIDTNTLIVIAWLHTSLSNGGRATLNGCP